MSKELKCRNCNYEWHYKGNSEFWATCPNCLRKVSLRNRDIKKDE